MLSAMSKYQVHHCIILYTNNKSTENIHIQMGGCHGRDHMVVGLTTNYAISAYHH